MVISMCVGSVAIPRIVPLHWSLSRWSKVHQPYPVPNNVSLSQSGTGRVSSPISFPQAKASPAAMEIIRTIYEIDDSEVQEELDILQNAYKRLKNIFCDIVMVLAAINPILRLLIDAIMSNNQFLRRSSFGALYGALIVLNEFVKILWKSQAFRGYNIIVGFLIYKINKYNIALHRKGRRAVWLDPLFVLVEGKFVVDGLVSIICSVRMSVNANWAFVEFIASCCVALFWTR